MSDSVFETYEPHTDYIQVVTLREDNFDSVAEEISRWSREGISGIGTQVSKNMRYGQPESLTVSMGEQESVTCHLHQCFVLRSRDKELTVMDRHDVRRAWRKVASDPYR